MIPFEYVAPTKIFFGKDTVKETGQAIKAYGGSRVLLHYGSERVLHNGLMDQVVASLDKAGLSYVLLGGVVPNPRVSLVREAIALVKRESLDFIFAVGGGSVIDSAKAIAIGACYDGDVWDFYDGTAVAEKALPTGNVLTIAAAGSETSKNSVLTNEDGWIKTGIANPISFPKFSILDPSLMASLPAYQTAAGIVDILMHTLERYMTPGGQSEITDCIAEQIMKNVLYYGKKVYHAPDNYEARAEMVWGGSLSHNGLTELGRLRDFSVHQLEHELSGKYDVTHGAGLSAIWGSWARYVYKADPMRFARFGVKVLDLPMNFANPEATAVETIETLEAYFLSIGMPITMTDCVGHEISDEDILDMAKKCSHNDKKIIGSLVKIDREMMIEIYKMAR